MASGPVREKKPLIVPILQRIKADPNFKEFIGFLARTDTQHDFGGNEFSIDANARNINKGLDEVQDITRTNEHGALWNVLIELSGNTERDRSENLKGFLNSLSTGDFSTAFQVGFRSLENFNSTTRLHTYRAKCVDITDGQRGSTLKGACGLEDGGTLVVDFNQNGFLDKLSEAETGPKINVVTNAQTINDGAGKTKYNDPILKGRTLRSIIDKKNKPTIYSRWDNNDMTANNLFLTSYQLELTPVIEVKSVFGKIQKLSVNITVTDPVKKTKSIIKDSKKNNTIGEILKKIRGIIGKFATKPFEVNEGFTRKRNGDWGQGTSGFTLNDGEYYGYDLTSKINDIIFNLDTIYYVTHDYIAAAYILLLGLNLLFLTVASGQGPTRVEKRVYIFKNTAFVSNPAENYRDILSTKNDVLSALTLYNTARDQLLNIFIDDRLSGVQSSIFQEITTLDTDIDTIDYKNDKVILKDPLILKNKCIAILDRAYLHQQIKQTTPDPTGLIKELQPNIPNDLISLKKMYEAFIAAQNINKLYNNNLDFNGIIARIKISSIYLSLKHWTYTKELRTLDGISKRLGIKVGDGGVTIENQDKFAFIPFLATCDSEIKRPIVQVFKKLFTKLEESEKGGKQFIAGTGGRFYQHALLSFKILCETVCIYLGESILEKDNDFKKIISTKDNIIGKEQANLLSEEKVIKENQDANTNPSHLVDSSGEPREGAGAAAGSFSNQDSQSEKPVDIEENLVVGGAREYKMLEQIGGVFQLNDISLPRLLNHNSIKEATHVMLTAHLLLNAPDARAASRAASGAASGAAGGQANNALRKKINSELYVPREQGVYNYLEGGATPVITDTEIFSPTLPIYIVLEGLREVIPELNGHHDYEDYITYYLLLESMNEKLKERPLPLIGFALREILITFISTQVGRDTIAPLFHKMGKEYNLFPLTTTTISADVCGSFVDYDEGKPEVIELAKAVVESAEVKKYINSVIDIYKKKTRKSFYNGHKYNLKFFTDKVNTLQESIGKGIIHHKTASKLKSAKKMSMRKLKNLINNIHTFMTKRNREKVVLPNPTYNGEYEPYYGVNPLPPGLVARAYGGKRRKTMRRR